MGPTKTPWKPYTNPTQTLCFSLSLPRGVDDICYWQATAFVDQGPPSA